MPRIVIDNLDLRTTERLGQRAERQGRSVEDEAKWILAHATRRSMKDFLEEVAAWRAKVGDGTTDSVEMIREDRQR